MNDDTWEMFARLCQVVCEDGSVFLDVIISNGLIEFMLMPVEEDYEE